MKWIIIKAKLKQTKNTMKRKFQTKYKHYTRSKQDKTIPTIKWDDWKKIKNYHESIGANLKKIQIKKNHHEIKRKHRSDTAKNKKKIQMSQLNLTFVRFFDWFLIYSFIQTSTFLVVYALNMNL